MTQKNSLFISSFLFLLLTSVQSMACDTVFFDECLNGVGPAVTSSDSLRTSSVNLSNTIRQNRNEEKLAASSGHLTGRSAGDTFNNLSFWGNFYRTDFEADIPLANAIDGLGNPVPLASYDADTVSFMVGVDTLLSDSLVLGLAIGYEDSDIDTDYNGGNNTADGYTVSPYLAYLFTDEISADISAGYSKLSYDTDRIDNTNGNIIYGDFDSDRWYLATNLNLMKAYNNWLVSGRIGYLYTEEEQDGYVETGGPTARTIRTRHIDLSQVNIGVELAYTVSAIEPYATLTYYNDLSSDDGFDAGGLPGDTALSNSDDDEIQTGIGLRYFGHGVSGTLEWTRTIGRSYFDEDAILATLRVDM